MTYTVNLEYLANATSRTTFEVTGAMLELFRMMDLVTSGVQVSGRVTLSVWPTEHPERFITYNGSARELQHKLNEMIGVLIHN